ncbi:MULTISPECIES: replication initiation protein RepM [Psychrobacter]|uniref:replication initiation protein RepM n=1 Tax=Psychrobacter TaxID=497 RepID=UPI001919CB6F|nr:replication initiation protein RepM [Psychrobacter piscatorii]|tara:strand:- start:20 stop:967 length:948 start_codon:yes stop_codon:yes gene_type:complete
MQKQLVTKDNSLIGASYSLGVVEQRLIFLAIIEAREQKTLIEAGGLLRIYAQSYAKQFDVEKHTSYEAMKRAVEGLYEAGFAYSKLDERTGKVGHYKSRWVDKIGYIDDLGCVELVFASDVIPLITRLEARYTEYELKQVVGLQSEYAIRLYELVIQWRSVRKTNLISLSELREKLGLVDEYKRIEAFKRRVLDLAVKQINEHTDITVEYEQHKQGRVITGFTFKFRIKTQAKKLLGKKRDSDMPDMLTPLEMTDKQKGVFAAKLSKMSELANYAKQGEDYKAFAERIETELLDESKHSFYAPYLDKLGFRASAS